jgi:hypothetical protein
VSFRFACRFELDLCFRDEKAWVDQRFGYEAGALKTDQTKDDECMLIILFSFKWNIKTHY